MEKLKSRYKGLIGKEVEVIFQDSEKTTSKRNGDLVQSDNQFVHLRYSTGTVEILPIHRIIRIKEIVRRNGK